MSSQPLSRRDQHRVDTVAEIKAHALALLESGGPAALSLRGIAREMRMTPGALYGYFATRDDLVTTLLEEAYASLVAYVESARDAERTPSGRLVAWGQAFRAWALDHRELFRLIYGAGVPGYARPEHSPVAQAEQQLCEGLIDMVVDIRRSAGARSMRAVTTGDADEYAPALVAYLASAHPDAPLGMIPLALRAWGRMHGLVALEVDHHLGSQVRDRAALHRDDLEALALELTR
jgi:AcrR family transcriptional regulator